MCDKKVVFKFEVNFQTYNFGELFKQPLQVSDDVYLRQFLAKSSGFNSQQPFFEIKLPSTHPFTSKSSRKIPILLTSILWGYNFSH